MPTKSPTYLNFDLQISQAPTPYRLQVLDAPGGNPSATFTNPFTYAEQKLLAQQLQFIVQEAKEHGPDLEKIGGLLFNALFHGEISNCFRVSLDRAQKQGAGLRIRLRLDDVPELIGLPWEYLYDPKREHFLALLRETAITHFPALPDPPKASILSYPLRILTIIANPSNLDSLDVEQEWLSLRTALADLITNTQVELHRLQMSTIQELQEKLRRTEYHILHFIGHGQFDETSKSGLLFFMNEAREAHPVPASDLAMLLHNAKTLRLVVLNACEGASTSKNYQFAGTAQRLVQQGIPAVVAMQRGISDQIAKTFAQEFYKALVDGFPIEAALTESRLAIRLTYGGVEWGTPRLYMHTKDGQLWQQHLSAPATNTAQSTRIIFEDGGMEVDEQTPHPPLPEFDSSILKELESPTGAVKLRDKFYIEREEDERLREQLLRMGTTTLIRAPRQTGKTSLVSRGIQYANKQDLQSVYLSFQPLVETGILTSLDRFLYEFGAILCRKLHIDKALFDQAWASTYDAPQKLTFFWEDHIFPKYDTPIILAIDEADSLLSKPYAQGVFSLLRSWHEQRAFDSERWNLLNLVLVISTEPYLLIQDINQSPFNVGERIELRDFTEAQVQTLNQRHGSPITRGEMLNFMTLLGGHPYLTRLALYEMVKYKKSWQTIAKDAITDQGIFREHLQDLFKKIYQQPALQSALLTIIRTHRCPDRSSLIRLLRAGVVKGSGERFSCRCELYRQYLEPRL